MFHSCKFQITLSPARQIPPKLTIALARRGPKAFQLVLKFEFPLRKKRSTTLETETRRSLLSTAVHPSVSRPDSRLESQFVSQSQRHLVNQGLLSPLPLEAQDCLWYSVDIYPAESLCTLKLLFLFWIFHLRRWNFSLFEVFATPHFNYIAIKKQNKVCS